MVPLSKLAEPVGLLRTSGGEMEGRLNFWPKLMGQPWVIRLMSCFFPITQDMWNLSSPDQDRTHAVQVWSLSHWSTREVPPVGTDGGALVSWAQNCTSGLLVVSPPLGGSHALYKVDQKVKRKQKQAASPLHCALPRPSPTTVLPPKESFASSHGQNSGHQLGHVTALVNSNLDS